MSSYKKLACFLSTILLSTILLSTLPLFGQYQATSSAGVMDNPSLCVSTNCWNRIGNGFNVITAAFDGTVLAEDSNGVIWWWDNSTEAWVNVHWDPTDTMVYITAGSASQIYGLSNASSNNVFQLVSGSWVSLPGNWECSQISAAYDGTLWCLNSAGHAYYYAGGAWHQTTTLWTLKNIAARSYNSVIGVGPNGDIYGYNGITNTWNDAGHFGATISQSPGAIASSDDGTVAFVDTSGAVHLARDGGTTFYTLSGFTHMVAAGSAISIISSGPTNTYHYTGTMAAATQSTTGSYQGCPGCNPPGYHTGTASASFPHGLNSGSTQGQTPHDQQMNYSHQDYSPSCDPIFTFGNPECNAALGSTVTCPVMGTLLNTGSPDSIFQFDQMAGLYKRAAGPPQLGRQENILKLQYYDYPIASWCSNGTPNPVLTIAEDTQDHNYWTTFSVYVGSTYLNKWTLFWSKSIGLAGPEAPAPCDLTPQPFFTFL